MKNDIIGIFDSGVGGLTVFSKLVKKLPEENYVYFGDTKNLPYGSKSQDELVKLAKKIFDFYAQNNAKAVVMACNTTSAITYDILKNDYDFIIYPVIQIASENIAKLGVKKIGVLSTEATANSHAYKTNIQKHDASIEVIEQGCPGLVQIVENKTFDEPESINLAKKYLEILTSQNAEKVILGCTHYPYLKDIFTQFAPKELFIDPAESFVEYIYNDLKSKKMLCDKKQSEPKFIVSAEPEKFRESAALFYELDKNPTLCDSGMI